MTSQATGMFISETHTEAVTWMFSIEKMLHEGKTQFQEYQIAEVPRFGKSLFLDHNIQTSLLDEFIFHECMVQPAMVLHPNPKKVLVCGGGEGATLREVLKHNTVEKAVMVDIDEELIDMVRVHMPEWHQGSFEDPRTTMVFTDARKYVECEKGAGYDVVISDLTNPHEAGPSLYLFTKEFFQLCADAMSDEGVFIMQAGAANLNYPECLSCCVKTLEDMKDTFAYVRPIWAIMTTFMLPWGYVLASKKHDPLEMGMDVITKRLAERGVQTKYYTPRFHESIYTMPDYLLSAFEEHGRVLTDAKPYIWTA